VTNAVPVADDEHYSLHAGQNLLIPAPGVLEGDTDADGDPLRVVSTDTTGTHGTVNLVNDGGLQFTPEAGFVGTTSFKYTVSDGLGGTDEGLVTIDVTNTAPSVTNDSYTVSAGNTLTVDVAGGLLANDTDADGDLLQVLSVDPATNGILNVAANGSLVYTPNAGFVGVETLAYTVSDGAATVAGEFTINVTSGLSLEAGSNAVLDEGDTFSRTVIFDDGVDNGTPGWSYSVDYGDGTSNTGTTLVKTLALNHQYTDGDANRTVSVTLIDEAGETASDSFQVTVNNVVPLAAVTGADTVNEGSVYALSVAAVTDPGADTRTGYSINWGDGTVVQNLTPAQWATAAGSFSHTYADGGNGGTARTVIVSATDEDGTFTLGSKVLTVNNVAPAAVLAGAAAVNEGAAYFLSIIGSDAGEASDTLSYSINWATAVQLKHSALQT